MRMLSSLLFSLHRSFMFELKQQVLSGALDEAIDSQTSVARLLGALQGWCAPSATADFSQENRDNLW